jgi:hypothetical protein
LDLEVLVFEAGSGFDSAAGLVSVDFSVAGLLSAAFSSELLGA